MKKSRVLKTVSNEFAKKYGCRAYTTSNFSIRYQIIYPSIGLSSPYELGYLVKLKHSFSKREAVANLTFETNKDKNWRMFVTLKNDKDMPVIENIRESCGNSIDVIVLT